MGGGGGGGGGGVGTVIKNNCGQNISQIIDINYGQIKHIEFNVTRMEHTPHCHPIPSSI